MMLGCDKVVFVTLLEHKVDVSLFLSLFSSGLSLKSCLLLTCGKVFSLLYEKTLSAINSFLSFLSIIKFLDNLC